MSKNVAIAGAVVVGVTALAGLGWKVFKDRKASKAAPVKTEPVKAEVKAPVVETKVEPPKSTLSVRKTPTPQPVKEVAIEEPVREVLVEDGKVEEPVEQSQVEDIITKVDGGLASVARARIPTEEPSVDKVQTPLFWKSFYNNIRREEVVELYPQDFLKIGTKPNLPKGYHKATVYGYDNPAIAHVTKGHVSVVVFLGGSLFVAFSTSASRFTVGEEINNAFVVINAKQAKDFLNGR